MVKNQLSSTITLQDISDLLDKKLDARFVAFEQKLDKKLDKKLDEKLAPLIKKIEKMDETIKAMGKEMAIIKADIIGLKGSIDIIKADIIDLKGSMAQLELKLIRFEREFEKRSSYWESFANGVDSFMGEIVESRKNRTQTDKKLMSHEKRLCVLEYSVLHSPKDKEKYDFKGTDL